MHEELTQSQKCEWIDDQIRDGGSVFCPWCSALNRAGEEDTPCCTAFSLAIRDRADRQIKDFANQYTAVEVGVSSSIRCPYCGMVNRAPAPVDPSEWKRPFSNPFCCDLFCHALVAHLEVKRVQSLVHMADKIAEGMDKAGNN